MSGHSWSGWPGAWCLHCGCCDPVEEAMANNEIDFVDDPDAPGGMRQVVSDEVADRIRKANVCPEPGSNRHNPYSTKS